MRVSILVAFTIAHAAVRNLAAPAPTSTSNYAVHEKRHLAASSWMQREKIHPKAVLPVRIGLKQRNLEKGHDILMDVSHPDSPNYAKHWTSEEVIQMFAPADETVAAVRTWLIVSGIDEPRITHSENKGWLAFDATTEEVEDLLHAEYYGYEHTATGQLATACDSYHVPKQLQEHIDYVTPGVKLFSSMKRGDRRRGFGMTSEPIRPPAKLHRPQLVIDDLQGLETCDQAITPICIQALYNVPSGTHAHPENAMGIFEEGDFYAQEDLDLFFANFTPHIPQGTHPKPAFINGAEAPVPVQDAGEESDLDMQLAYPLLYPQGTVLYQTDDKYWQWYSTGFFNTFLDAIDGSYCTYSAYGETGNDPELDPIYPDPNAGGYKGELQCGVYKPTNVISISYGGHEIDLPAYYQERQCNEFMKLGLQGISIIFASGDYGVAGPPGDFRNNGCLSLNGTRLQNGSIFSPAWPNNCPYVTNVGATKVYPGKTVFEPESAVVDLAGNPYSFAYSSGGGFSNIYAMPNYQKDAVSTYFQNHNPPYKYYSGGENLGKDDGVYNRLGRGYPDVAANGDNTATYHSGLFGLSGGTSASTPIFASIVNRINEERLLIGKKPVGFINPALYSNPWVLNDITNGSNPGCGTDGFYAVKGWDPVTGLGTPNYPKMLALFLGLP